MSDLVIPGILSGENFCKQAHLALVARKLVELACSRGVDLPCWSFFDWTAEVDVPPVDDALSSERAVDWRTSEGPPGFPGDLFGPLYQEAFSNASRHPLGEFFTPAHLARSMVGDGLAKLAREGRGERLTVVDPACGTGTFLLEVVGQLERSGSGLESRVVGFDANPLSVLLAGANLAVLRSLGHDAAERASVHLLDFLFPHDGPREAEAGARVADGLAGRTDFVVGNPPWLVVNRVASSARRAALKELGKRFGVFLGGKTATSTEVTTLFVGRARDSYLREGGVLSFVTPASLLSGGQHALFRSFDGLRDVTFWRFERDAFRVHATVFTAKKGEATFEERTRPRVVTFRRCGNSLQEVSEKFYRPATLKFEGTGGKERVLVGRLNPEPLALPVIWGESPYKAEFFQGASLVPRKFLFVDVEASTSRGRVRVRPAKGARAKWDGRWKEAPYESAEVEERFVFPVAKSSNLVPGLLLRTEPALLPIVPHGDGYRFVGCGEASASTAAHFGLLARAYEERRKPQAGVRTLLERLNYHGYLLSPLQRAPVRVVYNAVGSRMKAAALRDRRVVVDTSLYQCAVRDEWEAAYLVGVFNSPLMTEVAKLVGSTGAGGSLRNLHLSPLNVRVPKYRGDDIQREMARLGGVLERRAREVARATVTCGSLKVQNRLFADEEFLTTKSKLDELARRLLAPVV
ncbi:MAG: hypothetical protein Kow0069_06860 [Promethearchaeota archaeon]